MAASKPVRLAARAAAVTSMAASTYAAHVRPRRAPCVSVGHVTAPDHDPPQLNSSSHTAVRGEMSDATCASIPATSPYGAPTVAARRSASVFCRMIVALVGAYLWMLTASNRPASASGLSLAEHEPQLSPKQPTALTLAFGNSSRVRLTTGRAAAKYASRFSSAFSLPSSTYSTGTPMDLRRSSCAGGSGSVIRLRFQMLGVAIRDPKAAQYRAGPNVPAGNAAVRSAYSSWTLGTHRPVLRFHTLAIEPPGYRSDPTCSVSITRSTAGSSNVRLTTAPMYDENPNILGLIGMASGIPTVANKTVNITKGRVPAMMAA
eukprot:m.477436 g.477436  ORF g.477436 m.477436 type:complete len:318 (-) comp20845_c0_seq1:1025-1978(-)